MEQNRKSNFLKIKPADYDSLANLFDRALTKKVVSTNILIELLQRKMPIHFGGMSDPFQPIEKKYKLTLKIMKLLLSHNYPTIFSTKSSLIVRREYLDILKEMENKAVQISLITSNDKIRQKFEPKASSVNERLDTIRKLSNNDIWTSCRIQALIPHVNENDLELVDKLADAGCKHVIIEHYKLPTFISKKSIERLNHNCGYDIATHYRNLRKKPRGIFLELPASKKIKNLKKWSMRYITEE